MLCANVATARFLNRLDLPAIYRIHSGPQPKKLKMLRGFLLERGLHLSGGEKPAPAHYNKLIGSLGSRTDTDVIQTMMLRSLSQAEYSADNEGHFGLAYSTYTHFTSPIRRYPDLLVHRAVRAVIRGNESGGFIHRALKSFSGVGKDRVQRVHHVGTLDRSISYPYDMESIERFAANCSQLSRRADKASWEVDAWLKCDFMRESIGEVFHETVTGVTTFGLFLELSDTKIEGMLHISSLNNDNYQYDEMKQSLIGDRHKNIFAAGDSLEVVVARVDMDHRKIEFNLKSGKRSEAKKHKG